MHKYFLIPTIIFFITVCLVVIYLQFFYVEWKYRIIAENFDVRTGKYKEIILSNICNDEGKIKIITLDSDHIINRSFKDKIDASSNFQFHAVYLLPCEVKDRKFDINQNIQYSLKSINEWFLDKTKNQIISIDKKNNDLFDITFIRVNKTTKWFTQFNSNENSKKDAGSKIENIILSNSSLFNNFNKKKFIVFFDGWEKRISLSTEICGRSRYNGKIAIFYTNSKAKKSRSCTVDNVNDTSNEDFGESEGTILHEMLHTLGMPPKCATNLESDFTFHVSDSAGDIMNKVSGSLYLDFNNDDYYKHKINNCSDLSKNNYLIYVD